jgi:hypothetical protein
MRNVQKSWIAAGAATLIVAVALALCFLGRYGGHELQGVLRSDELRDVLQFDSPERKRSALIEYARRQLKRILQKYDSDLVVRGNCIAVESRLEKEFDSTDAAPMAIASSLIPCSDGRRHFLFLWCYNPHREDNAIILLGKTVEGATLRVCYEWKPTMKAGAVVGMFAGPTRLVTVGDLYKAGEVSRSSGDIEVRICVEDNNVPVVPDVSALAVALHDRNGRLSNFVPVVRVSEGGGKRAENGTGPILTR